MQIHILEGRQSDVGFDLNAVREKLESLRSDHGKLRRVLHDHVKVLEEHSCNIRRLQDHMSSALNRLAEMLNEKFLSS